MPAWFAWGYSPSSLPEPGRHAGEPGAQLLTAPHDKPQTLQQMHVRPQELMYQGPRAVSTSSWPVVPLLLWCTPGLAGRVGSQVLWSHIPLLPLSFRDFLPMVASLPWTAGLAVASTPWNKTACLIFVLTGLAVSFRSQGVAWEGQPC